MRSQQLTAYAMARRGELVMNQIIKLKKSKKKDNEVNRRH
jgi:hypothetical protein